jgi:hypothetical protein
MSTPECMHASLIHKLRLHLKVEEYSPSIQWWYPTLACRFLHYCDHEHLSEDAVRPAHVTRFLQRRYRLFRRRHGESPRFRKWRL